MSRYIDADALIDAHYDYCNEHSYDETAVFYTWSKRLIDSAPTIDAVSEWIPCSERMPSEQGEYLVTVTYEGDTYVECLHYGKPTMANREVKGECFYDSDDEWGDIVYDTEAIAWMPLPKPYGEREGE